MLIRDCCNLYDEITAAMKLKMLNEEEIPYRKFFFKHKVENNSRNIFLEICLTKFKLVYLKLFMLI